MATVTLTVRYLDQLQSHGKRFEVFDALVPRLAIRVSASGRSALKLSSDSAQGGRTPTAFGTRPEL
jgi:hypothetical protein